MALSNYYTYDAATLLKDAGLVAASAAATVGGSAAVINVGSAWTEGVAVIDVTAIETDSSNEIFTIIMQGSADAAFTTPVTLGSITLGHTSAVPGGGATATIGRHYLRFGNEQDSTLYAYLRIYTYVAGTVGTGINFSAWIGDTKSAS